MITLKRYNENIYTYNNEIIEVGLSKNSYNATTSYFFMVFSKVD